MHEFKMTRRVGDERTFLESHHVSLIQLEGKDIGKSYVLDKERVTIGRSEEAHVMIDDDLSSRFHAVMALGPKGYDIRDLHSTNGTIVNGSAVELHALAHGDSIRIGSTVLQYLAEPRAKDDSRLYKISG